MTDFGEDQEAEKNPRLAVAIPVCGPQTALLSIVWLLQKQRREITLQLQKFNLLASINRQGEALKYLSKIPNFNKGNFLKLRFRKLGNNTPIYFL